MKKQYTMNRYLCWIFSCVVLLSSHWLQARQSPNMAKFRVIYDTTAQTYTAWAEADHAMPNSTLGVPGSYLYNQGTNDLGSTAQVVVKMPIGVDIQAIIDVSGAQCWDKGSTTLGPGLSITATNENVFTPDYNLAIRDQPEQFINISGVAVVPTVEIKSPDGIVVAGPNILVSGTATSGSTVVISAPGNPMACSVVATNGVFSCTVSLPDGIITVTAIASNSTGTTTDAATFTSITCGVINAPVVSPTSATVCPGKSLILTAIGEAGATYSWTGAGLNQTAGNLVTATPTGPFPTVYTVTQTVNVCISKPAFATVVVSVAACEPPMIAILTPASNGTALGPSVTVSGTATPGSSVTVGEKGSLLCSTTTTGSGSFSCSIPLSNGPHSITAIAQNPVGTSLVTPSTTFTVVNPVTPPGLTVLQSVSTSTSPVVSGTTNPGLSVAIVGPNPSGPGTVTLCNTVSTGSGLFSCTVSVPVGPNTLTVIAGGPGSNTTTQPVSFTAVPKPTVDVTGLSGTTTSSTTPTISGTATPGSTVVISTPGNPTACQTTASASGSFSCVIQVPVGPVSVTVVATNPGGTSTPDVTTFTSSSAVLATPPSLTVLQSVNTSTSPVVSGTTNPGLSVVIVGPNPSGPGTITLCQTTASNTGTFSCTVNVPVGPNTLTVIAGGLGSNTTSQPVSFTAVPKPTVAILGPTPGSNPAGPTVVVSGTATPGSSVTIGENGTSLCSTTATATGSFSCAIPLADGSHNLTATAQNPGGSTTTTPRNITVATPASSSCVTMNLKVLLEGPYDAGSGLMSTVLNQRGLLPGQVPVGDFAVPTPAGQPYNVAPWNYAGPESLTAYPTTVTDWVLISLRTSNTDPANAFQVAGLLHDDGHISFVQPCFLVPSGSYYVVIEHRNHLGVMSPTTVSIVNHVMTVDFTQQESYVITEPPSFGQIQIGNKWLMYAADGSKADSGENFDVNFNDSLLWQLESGIFDQYRLGDFNLDADVNSEDSVLWKKNNGRYSRVPQP